MVSRAYYVQALGACAACGVIVAGPADGHSSDERKSDIGGRRKCSPLTEPGISKMIWWQVRPFVLVRPSG